MKAKVQYNDYVGTSAADMSDDLSLKQYLDDLEVDTNRYNPIGATFYVGNQSSEVYFSIICIDKERGDKSKAVKIVVENVKLDEVIALFKRCHVILTQDGYQNYELVDEPVEWVKK